MTPQQKADAAKALFEQATKEFHLPSAQATGAEKARLQQRAAESYEKVLNDFADQTIWAAQALRNLAGIRAAQTNINEAVRLYTSVAERFPKEEFEVLQSWKAAGDLLWEGKRQAEARKFYQQIVQRFDGTNQPAVVRLVVKGARSKLSSNEN